MGADSRNNKYVNILLLSRVGKGNPVQYLWLENPMDRGVWWATVHRVTKGQTRLSVHMHARVHTDIHTHTQTHTNCCHLAKFQKGLFNR